MCVDAVLAVADLERKDVNLDLIKVRSDLVVIVYFLPSQYICVARTIQRYSNVLVVWRTFLSQGY